MFCIAGLLDVLTAKYAITAATKSTPKCIASEIKYTEPIRVPIINFPITNKVLETTESRATCSFLSFILFKFLQIYWLNLIFIK